jgi:hypothetical protein
MSAHISFNPLLPWSVVIALAVLTLLPCLLALGTRRRGGLLRLAGFALLVLILAGPRWVEHSARPLPDVALVLVDQSPSMEIGARREMAARALAALRASAGRTDATRLIVAGIPPATSGGTQILPALHQALANIEPDQLAGIVAITDGEITDAAGLPRDAPFSALLTASGEETDRELRLDNAPSFGLAGQTVPLRLTVFDHGVNDAGTTVPVTVTEDGQTVATVAAVVGQPLSINLPVRHAGPAVIAASAPPLAGAVSAINDQAAFTLTGIHKRLNVLLVSGSPNQGERAWRLLLKSDPAVQLVHFTILRMPGEPLDADPRDIALVPFPVRELFETDITKFDLIILDQFNANDLLPAEYLANIAAYVQNGGALLAEVGPEFAGPESLAGSPLGPILPAIPAAPGTVTQEFPPLITPLGARHPVTASFAGAKLAPWGRMEAATPTPGSLVLMTGADNLPLLVLGRAGKGRTGILLSDQLWLWTRGGAHAGPALPLLRGLVHWFLHEPALEAEALTATIAHDRLSIDRRTLSPSYPGDATITDPDGQSRIVPLTQTAPGRYTATLPLQKNTGVWKISEGGKTAYAVAAPDNAAEYQDLAATASKVRGVAHNIVWLGRDPAPALGPLLTHRHATQITGTASQPLLPPLPALLIALALITAAWWRENGASA